MTRLSSGWMKSETRLSNLREPLIRSSMSCNDPLRSKFVFQQRYRPETGATHNNDNGGIEVVPRVKINQEEGGLSMNCLILSQAGIGYREGGNHVY